jgi:enoyl-CoA hydratase/carnithine racemase
VTELSDNTAIDSPDSASETSTPGRDTVYAQRRGAVLLLTFNRPERLNAWNDELEATYFDLLAEADADPETRAIVVTGAGRGFCAGADMDKLSNASEADVVPALRDLPRPRTFPMTVRKPMIAAINGAAAGIGIVQALYCDVRFATPEAKLTTAFSRRGLVAEYGLSWLLPRIIGLSGALDLLLSGRVLRGEEARQLRLVDRLSEPERLVEDAITYAEDLAKHCSPWSMATIKAQVLADLARPLDAALNGAEELTVQSVRGPDIAEGVNSYLERRPPAFPGLA